MDLGRITFNLEQIDEIVKKHLISRLKTHSIFAFQGPLGAGKTTLIKRFLKQVGVPDIITSPTFTYVKEYKASGGKNVYHFDLYRLDRLDDFIDLGFDEYLYSKSSLSLIEWPESIKELLQDTLLRDKVCIVKVGYFENDLHRRVLQIID